MQATFLDGRLSLNLSEHSKETIVNHLNNSSDKLGQVVGFESCSKRYTILVKSISMTEVVGFDADLEPITFNINRFSQLSYGQFSEPVFKIGDTFASIRKTGGPIPILGYPDIEYVLSLTGQSIESAFSHELIVRLSGRTFVDTGLDSTNEALNWLHVTPILQLCDCPALHGMPLQKCPLTGKLFPRSLMLHIKNTYYSVEGIATVGIELTCTTCGKRFTTKEARVAVESSMQICPECYEKTPRCCKCGKPAAVTVSGIGMCEGHARNRDVRDYHSNTSRHEPKLIGKVNPDFPLYLGVELEVDRLPGSSKAVYAGLAKAIAERDLGYEKIEFTRDGSLSDVGMEMISQPKTIGAWHASRGFYQKVFESFVECNYRGHDSQVGGFHVHVSRAAFKPEEGKMFTRLNVLIYRFFDNVLILSRRTKMRLSQYARYDSELVNVSPFTADHLSKLQRFRALSTGDSHAMLAVDGDVPTFEFRVFRSTLNIETFMATLDFVYGLCKFVKEHDFDTCNTVSWDELLAFIGSDDLNVYWERIAKVAKKRTDGEASRDGDDTETDKQSVKEVDTSELDALREEAAKPKLKAHALSSPGDAILSDSDDDESEHDSGDDTEYDENGDPI